MRAKVAWVETSQTAFRGLFVENCGLIIAITIILGWLIHVGLMLSLNLHKTPIWIVLSMMLLQTFLNTGMFITAHDAIHGLVCPTNSYVNACLGTFCAIAYAGLSYPVLVHNHQLHHRYPASIADPDFYPLEHETGKRISFIRWYQHFMGQYLSGSQFIQIGSVLVIGLVLGISFTNIILLWGFPLFLSSLQLFYFGTFQPHCPKNRGHRTITNVNPSDEMPWLLSLLICYHFSYHQEHHERPDLPWWGLPTFYKAEQ